jgi:hypothetical protein
MRCDLNHLACTFSNFEQAQQAEVEKSKMVYGMAVGPTNAAAEEDEDEELDGARRTVKAGQRVRLLFIAEMRRLILS